MISISRRTRTTTLLALVALVVTPLLVEAHHGMAMFDEKQITIDGVVKEFQYTNPHSWLLVDVTNKDGSVTTWGFEAEGPSSMLRAGIHKGDLTPGTKVSVTGHPMKDGRPAANWTKVVRADGMVFELHGFGPQPGDTPPAAGDAPPAGGK